MDQGLGIWEVFIAVAENGWSGIIQDQYLELRAEHVLLF